MEFYERVSGARLHAAYFRPGGVQQDMPAGMADDIYAFIEQFPARIDDIERLLTENRIFKQRTVDIGVVSAEQALDWGFSGPTLRGSGVAWDLRKAQPYDGYETMDFDIPIGKNGDCWDRYLVRMEEMRQSLRIMKQALDRMPSGPVRVDDRKVMPPPRERDEILDGSADPPFQALYRGLSRAARARPTPPSRRPRASSACISSPMAATGPIAARSARPASPSCKASNSCRSGHMLADMVAIIGSLDIVFGEVDR